jgi:hypothetical protein
MAAEPIPMPAFASEVDIDDTGKVTGQVKITNKGHVTFNVEYPTGYDVCVVNITQDNISWETSASKTENTIKVGNGGGVFGRRA